MSSLPEASRNCAAQRSFAPAADVRRARRTAALFGFGGATERCLSGAAISCAHAVRGTGLAGRRRRRRRVFRDVAVFSVENSARTGGARRRAGNTSTTTTGRHDDGETTFAIGLDFYSRKSRGIRGYMYNMIQSDTRITRGQVACSKIHNIQKKRKKKKQNTEITSVKNISYELTQMYIHQVRLKIFTFTYSLFRLLFLRLKTALLMYSSCRRPVDKSAALDI